MQRTNHVKPNRIKHWGKQVVFGLAGIACLGVPTLAQADAVGVTCDQMPVRERANNVDEQVPFSFNAGDNLLITVSGEGLDDIIITVPSQDRDICRGAQCASASFTSQIDQAINIRFIIRRNVTLELDCGDVPELSDVTDPKRTATNIDQALKIVNRIAAPGASVIASAALNGGLGLTDDMVRVDTRSAKEKAYAARTGSGKVANQLNLMGKINDNEFAVGFEHKLGAISGDSDQTGNAIIGNARYYDFDGVVAGDAWHGQIGFRHDLGNDRTATVYGSFRNADISARRIGLSIDEDTYGVGAIVKGPIGEAGLIGTAVVNYEGGEADIVINNARGTADTSRLSAALAVKGNHEHGRIMLSPRLMAGLVQFDRDGYTDSVGTVINGSNDTEHFIEAGVRLKPLTREEGKADWFLDGSVDYASATLDGVIDLQGRRIDDNDFAGNVEAGLTFALDNGSTLIVSGGGRGLGRESHAIFGNMLLRVPFSH